MALNKQNVPINFAQGVDTKSDPFQVPLGKFLSLENAIFDKANRLTKRNGYGPLSALPDSSSTFLTTFNENLTAVGDRFFAYSEGSRTWVDKGPLRSVDLNVLPLVRSSLNQSQGDCAIAANGWICTAYTESLPVAGVATATYSYVIADSTTGQNITLPASIPDCAGAPKVFLLGNYFIIVYPALITATPHLKFLAINSRTGVLILNEDISNSFAPATTGSFDAVSVNNNLYVAWAGADVGGTIRVTKIDNTLTVFSDEDFAGETATVMNVCADTSGVAPIIYVTFFDDATGDAKILAVSQNLDEVLAPTTIDASADWANITALAADGVCHVYYEVNETYSNSEPSNYIEKVDVSVAGVVGTPAEVVRSVGLASKLFEFEDMFYFMAAYESDYQPTYFLMDEDGNVLAKLAYSNGGGYCRTGLPSVTLDGSVARIPYLRRNTLQAVNKSQGIDSPGVFGQTGVNLASFDIGTSDLGAAEIGSDLHLTGGFVWMYDGFQPVEHGFHLWPDNLSVTKAVTGGGLKGQQYYYVATYEWADNQGNVFRSAPSIPLSVLNVAGTAYQSRSVFAIGASTITVVDASGFRAGQLITDATTGANITAGTTITSVNTSTNVIGLSLPTAGNSAGSPGDLISTVETNENTVKIPTLRLTYKIDNPVKVVLYRWSAAQQTYYQITSIAVPLLNDVEDDEVTFVDELPDNQIIGNNILYTTGGVVENIAAPACAAMTLFKSRLVVLDAEDRNTLWFSKQVIQGVPAEMSDLFTIYVSPTVSAQGSTGPVTTLAALDDKLVLFKKNAIYYLVGTGPDNAGGNNDFSEPVFITSTIGCTNQQSLVFVPSGLMFQSDKGIWLLGRDLSTKYIGAPVEDYTREGTVQSAVNVPGTNQVRFTLDSGITLMYDYFYEQWGTFTNVPAISSTLYNGLHTYLDNLGRVFQETPGAYLDRSSPVLMSFTTSWLNLAGLQGYERAYEFYLLGTYISPHKLNMLIAYDYNPSPTQQSVITPDNIPETWGSDPLWGSGTPWGGSEGGNVEQWRVFLQQQKCQAFQITMQEVFDPSFGTVAGAGLTLSGIDLTVGLKKGRPALRASRAVG